MDVMYEEEYRQIQEVVDQLYRDGLFRLFPPPSRVVSVFPAMTDLALARAFTDLGVRKLRLTGGEPLLRPGLPALVEQLAAIRGLDDIALTTNGIMLPRLAGDLAKAGLRRITVSLDTLDQAVLDTMSGGRARLEQIMEGIAAAEAAGFERLKINTVVQKGVNDHTVMDLLAHFRGTPHQVRLIEFMDVGNTNHWSPDDVVPNAEWVERIGRRWPIRPIASRNPAETARRYEYVDGMGEIGLISSITQPFCGGCTRGRVTADGVVASVEKQRGLGRLVKVDHGNGVVTVYAHLQESRVKKGQRVGRGEVIALSGNSGRSTAPHLHYEVRVRDRAVNPLNYILDTYADLR